MLDSNLITAFIVASGAGVNIILGMIRDKRLATLAKAQHEWENSDRQEKSNLVMGAIRENTAISTHAVTVGQQVDQKLAVLDVKIDAAAAARPNSEAILAKMMTAGEAVAPAEIAQVLDEMRVNMATLESYAHNSVHRINNVLAIMQAAAELHHPST